MSSGQTYHSPFDSIAADYDRIFTGSCTGKAQRDAVWQETDKVFQTGLTIFEMNCGTGVDAVHFASRGLTVFAIDQSAKMIDVARNRLNHTGFGQRVQLKQMAIEEMSQYTAHLEFDGAFSNFGGLNCVAGLSRVTENLGRLLRPGSSVLLCFMSRYCLWEWAYYLGRFQFRKAFRRLRDGGTTADLENQETLHVYYPGIIELVRVMQPHFRYVWHKAVGLAVPPSYLESWVMKHPVYLRIARTIDTRVSRWPVLRSLGDHCLVHFMRR